ncbi:hypothetical protein ABFS82_02G155200 [Erythranthe guttata]
MEYYKRFVRRNKDYVHSLESLANGLTWLLPERFSESEIGPEAVTSFLGIITTINEHILDTTPTQIRQVESSSFPLSLCITLLKDLETLVEVAGQQLYGEENKWNFMAVTEAIKASLRLASFRNSGYKVLLHGGESINDGNDHSDFDSRRNVISKNHHENNSQNLEGRALFALSRFGENARTISEPTWLRRVQHQQAIMDPPSPVAETTSLSDFLSEKGISGGFFLTGEVMFILRPLVYVLLVRRYGVRSWLPWLASFGVDLVGHGIISAVRHISNDFRLSNAEKSELKRRKFLWALYLMRDPFFTKYTRRRLDGTQKVLEPVPVVGLLTEKLVELITGAQTRYTYMSGS